MRQLSERVAQLDGERQAAERTLKYLDALATPGDSIHAGNPARVLETLRQGGIRAQQRILEIDAEKRELEREQQARQRDLERVRPAVAAVRQLELRLNARQDGQVRLRYLFAE